MKDHLKNAAELIFLKKHTFLCIQDEGVVAHSLKRKA